MDLDLPIKAKIVLKQGKEETASKPAKQGKEETPKPAHLSPVHVTSSSAHDTLYRVECPVWDKFDESPFDVIQSMSSFDGHDFSYSTERKKKPTAENAPAAVEPDFVLKVEKDSSDCCPIRIRVVREGEETEGEVIFVKPIMSLDGRMNMVYNVVLFMDPNSSKIEQRVKTQKKEYQDIIWGQFQMQLLIERRIRLLELCRELQLQGVSFEEENSSLDELPEISSGEESSNNDGSN